MKILAIVQARMGSKRLPGKVLLKIKDKTIIDLILTRISKSRMITKTIIATSNSANNKKLTKQIKDLKFDYYEGSEKDVLSRYIEIIKKYNPDIVVRLTADCPFADYKIVDKCINIFIKKKLDYVSNVNPHTFPDGFDVEVINPKSLISSFNVDKSKKNLEHVTYYIKKSNKFSKYNYESKINFSNFRGTLDTKTDYLKIKKIFKFYNYNYLISYKSVLQYLLNNNEYKHPKISKSINLWKKANKIIPNGNILLSKNPYNFT